MANIVISEEDLEKLLIEFKIKIHDKIRKLQFKARPYYNSSIFQGIDDSVEHHLDALKVELKKKTIP